MNQHVSKLLNDDLSIYTCKIVLPDLVNKQCYVERTIELTYETELHNTLEILGIMLNQ